MSELDVGFAGQEEEEERRWRGRGGEEKRKEDEDRRGGKRLNSLPQMPDCTGQMPGVRPIRICETPRRIIAKAVLFATKGDIQDAAGSMQLCAGQISGIEAAIRAMRSIYSS